MPYKALQSHIKPCKALQGLVGLTRPRKALMSRGCPCQRRPGLEVCPRHMTRARHSRTAAAWPVKAKSRRGSLKLFKFLSRPLLSKRRLAELRAGDKCLALFGATWKWVELQAKCKGMQSKLCVHSHHQLRAVAVCAGINMRRIATSGEAAGIRRGDPQEEIDFKNNYRNCGGQLDVDCPWPY